MKIEHERFLLSLGIQTLHPNATANEVTPPQNCRLLKLVSRQLSRRESIYRWLDRSGASAGASPAFLGLSLPYALIRCTHDLTYVCTCTPVSARGSILATSKCLVCDLAGSARARAARLGENSIFTINVIPPIAPLSARSF